MLKVPGRLLVSALGTPLPGMTFRLTRLTALHLQWFRVGSLIRPSPRLTLPIPRDMVSVHLT